MALTRHIADKALYLAAITSSLRKQWPDNTAVNIVSHGHSVPAGYFNTPVVDTFNAYPHLLHKGLKERFPFAVINVIVTAKGGENSESGAARFESDVLPHRPDVLLIDYGLNDRRIGLERASSALATMIEKALESRVKVILLTPTADTNAALDDPDDPLNQQAQLIRALAAQYHLGLVDSLLEFNHFLSSGGCLKDLMAQSNHPNRQGHDLVVAKLLEWFPD